MSGLPTKTPLRWGAACMGWTDTLVHTSVDPLALFFVRSHGGGGVSGGCPTNFDYTPSKHLSGPFLRFFSTKILDVEFLDNTDVIICRFFVSHPWSIDLSRYPTSVWLGQYPMKYNTRKSIQHGQYGSQLLAISDPARSLISLGMRFDMSKAKSSAGKNQSLKWFAQRMEWNRWQCRVLIDSVEYKRIGNDGYQIWNPLMHWEDMPNLHPTKAVSDFWTNCTIGRLEEHFV